MKQACITILLSMFMSMGGVMAYGQVQRTINVTTAGTLSELIPEDEKYQIEELTLTGELNGDDIYLIRDMAGIDMDKIEGFYYLGKECITDGKLRVLDLSGAKIVEGGREYYLDKMGSVSFSDFTYTKNDEISAFMFAYCHTLEELTLPSSATVISPFIFSGAKDKADKPQMNIKVIKVADGNTNYDSRDNCNAVIEKATSTFVVGCNGSTIPDGVVIIADNALMDCSGLESVTIPEGVMSIGNSAFSGCSGLTFVAIPNSLETIGEAAFYGCGNLASIVVGSGNTVYDSRDNCNAIIATSTNTLLLGCKNTIIPNGVTTIGGGAFSDCTGLESVTIPESVTSIGSNAFEGCIGLTSITIPNSVTEIAGSAFWKCTGLTSIIIPNGVTRIESGTFSMCSGLTSVTIPEGVKTIEDNAFYGCSGLTTVTIPEGVTTIGGGAFKDCSNLATISIPNSVTSIDGFWNNRAFSGTAWYDNQPDGVVYAGKVAYAYKGTMPENTKIEIEEGTTGIAANCFENRNLISVTIPSSVITIGDQAFSCGNLTSVTVDISSPIAIDRYHFSNRENATLYVPKGCKESYESADYWKEFKEIIEDETLKGSPYRVGDKFSADGVIYKVTSVDPLEVQVGTGDYSLTLFDYETAIDKSTEGAFAIPASVTGADGNSYAVTAIGNYAFSGCSGLTSVTIPKSVTSIEGAFYSCSGLASIVVEETNPVYDSHGNCNAIIKTADNELILGCKNTIIPNNVTRIGNSAFSGCSGLTSIVIPNGVTSIGGYAFNNCSGLTSVTIPNSVATIGSGAFEYCSVLSSISIPNSVTSIEAYAFEGCSGLDIITVDPNNTAYDSRNNCNAIIDTESNTLIVGCNNTIIPNGVVSIGSNAFSNRSGLTSVTIPNSVTSIGNFAFRGCGGVTSVTIPNSVTSIGIWAFGECSGLTSVFIPNSVTTIGYCAFQGCNGLTSITIPNSVTTLQLQTFQDCSGLTYIIIPGSVTSIENGVFYGCSNFTSMTVYGDNPPSVKNYYVDNKDNRANATLYVPKGSKEAYETTSFWKDFKEIVEFSLGDADGDGDVDQKDVDLVTEYIMNGNAEGLNLINATGSDRKVLNVADIVRIINIMNNK